MPSKSKKNASLRAPAKNVKPPDVTMFGVLREGHLDGVEDLRPDRLGASASSSAAR